MSEKSIRTHRPSRSPSRRIGLTPSSRSLSSTPSTSPSDMAARDGGRTLIVWRHGETAHNASGTRQGQLDTPLSDKGREQALKAAAALESYSPSVILSSDLQRAADT